MKDIMKLNDKIHFVKSRRGMLELDIIIQYFIYHRFNKLNKYEKKFFYKLLLFSDMDLYCWIIKLKKLPKEHRIKHLIYMIRNTFYNR